MEAKVRTKKWGSSLGVIIPKAIVEAKKIQENDEIVIEIKKRHLAKELFGKFPEWKSKKTSQQIKNEMRDSWD